MDVFTHTYDPVQLQGLLQVLLFSVVSVLIVLLLQYVIAWGIVMTRTPLHGRKRPWQNEEVITHTYAWARLAVLLLWLGLLAYVVLNVDYQSLFNLIPQAIAGVIAMVLALYSIIRIQNTVQAYKQMLRG